VLGVGETHLEASSCHLSDDDGFTGFSAVKNVADGRLQARPSHRDAGFGLDETETQFIENQKSAKFHRLAPKLAFAKFPMSKITFKNSVRSDVEFPKPPASVYTSYWPLRAQSHMPKPNLAWPIATPKFFIQIARLARVHTQGSPPGPHGKSSQAHGEYGN
jgi:hypothetical protein